MAEISNRTEGWHVGRADAASEWQGGPYTWEQLVGFAREGRLSATDLVWHPTMLEWAQAGEVPGLPVQQPVPVTSSASAPRKRTGLIVTVAVLGVLVLAAAGGGAFWALSRGRGDGAGTSGPNLGKAEVKLPDAGKLVATAEWGEVPSNQIGIVLADGAKRRDAEKVAKTVGGQVVGEIEYVNLYQIEFPGASEADLSKAIATVNSADKVELAFPNQKTDERAEIKGVRIDPYDDPMYGDGAGDGYKAVGVSKAWSFIKGSGIGLNNVHVGIVDTGLYRPGEGRESEFGGDVQIDFPDAEAGERNAPTMNHDGTANEAGSHGTGVATIIGADPDNGGPSGVAGPLGKKLSISLIDYQAGKYGIATTTPDPNDPTKVLWGNGTTYSLGDLVALKKQIENKATIINCSWGSGAADPALAAAYKKFFEKMAVEHPDVLFVCAAGNSQETNNAATSYPAGLKLPNMITVGSVDNEGAQDSSDAGTDFEITLAAPGVDDVVGIKGTGGAVQKSGTSFATPKVTAAAAMLRAINPALSAGEIKEILSSTARPGLTVGGDSPTAQSNLIPQEVGGKLLAIDEAVLKVINDMRAEKGLGALTPEMMEKMGVIDAIAVTGAPGEYKVRGIVQAAGEKGTQVRIDVTGDDHAIGGATTQSLAGAGEVTWDVTLPKNKGTIKVTRLDNGAASLITIEQYDINGKWSGTYTITDLQVTDQDAAEEEGCSLAIAEGLKGKPLPMTMDITADESGNGSAVVQIDVSSLSTDEGKATSEPRTLALTYSGSTITFQPGGSGASSMTGVVSREGDHLVMKGSSSAKGKGWSMKAAFTLSKPE